MKKILSSTACIFLIALSHAQYSYEVVNSQPVNKEISKIAVDNSGNIIFSGTFGTTITFGSFTLNSSTPDPYGRSAAFVVKKLTGGSIAWAKTFDPLAIPGNSGTSYVFINSLITDASGIIYLTGYFNGKVNFDNKQLSSTKNGSVYTRDMFTAKISSDGIVQWVKGKGTANDGCNAYEQGMSVATDNLGNVFATGSAISKSFKNTTVCSTICPGATIKSITGAYIVKYNSSGTIIWEKLFFNSQATAGGVCGKNTYGTNIRWDGSNVYVSGDMNGSVSFDSYTLNTGSESIRNSFLIKLNTNGQTMWAKSVTNTDNTTYWLGEGQCFLDDNNDDVYLSGLTYNSGTASFGNCSLITTATTGYLAKYSVSTGNCIWAINADGTVYGIVHNPDGNISILIRTDQSGQPATFAIKKISPVDGSTLDLVPSVMGSPAPFLRFWSGPARTSDGFVFCQNLTGSYDFGGTTISSEGDGSYADLIIARYNNLAPPIANRSNILPESSLSKMILYPNPV